MVAVLVEEMLMMGPKRLVDLSHTLWQRQVVLLLESEIVLSPQLEASHLLRKT